jgi:nitrate reductase NapE component
MLAVHEERIEQCHKADDYIGRLIEELKLENKDSHEAVVGRIEKVENKLEEIVKFRWIIVGVFAVVSFAFSQSHVVVDLLTPDSQQVEIKK